MPYYTLKWKFKNFAPFLHEKIPGENKLEEFMARFYSPTNDMVFKLLFSKAENSDVLIAFLTAVLQPKFPILSTTVLNPELPKGAADDKSVILDVTVRLSDNSKVDVEMQVDNRRNLRKRIPYYLARLHQTQLDVGDQYTKITPTASIVVLAYNETVEENFHTIYELRERNSHHLFTEDLRIHLIELLKVSSFIAKHPEERRQDVVFWTRFFSATTQEELEALAMERPIFEKASEALKVISNDPTTQQLLEDRLKAKINFGTAMDGAREEGIEIGIEKTHKKIVLNMHRKGMAADQIAAFLDIKTEDVELLLQESR